VLQCVAVCCSVCISSVLSWSYSQYTYTSVCCSVLQCVAVCCSVLQCVYIECVILILFPIHVYFSVLQYVAVCCSVCILSMLSWSYFQYIYTSVCCRVLQRVAACCSVLQCVVRLHSRCRMDCPTQSIICVSSLVCVFHKTILLIIQSKYLNLVPRILSSRIWSSSQDYAVLVLFLNMVESLISTWPKWSGWNIVYQACTSSERAIWRGWPLNIFTSCIGAGGCAMVCAERSVPYTAH